MEQALISHFECVLGRIHRGWGPAQLGHDKFQIIECRGGIHHGISTFATLGLHRYGLESTASSQRIHHELILCVPTAFGERHLPSNIEQVAAEALARGQAYLRGEVIGPKGELWEGSGMEAFYVSCPVAFPDDFAVCSVDDTTVVVAMLLPITRAEAAMVAHDGWRAFEQKLEDSDADVFDMERGSLSEG